MLVGLPLIGLTAIKTDISDYLEFPPITRYVVHAPFDACAFTVICVLDVMMLLGIALLLKTAINRRREIAVRNAQAFPPWGWWGIIIMLAGWMLAWTRFS